MQYSITILCIICVMQEYVKLIKYKYNIMNYQL